jgi:O-antigen/teichoic acid export membrane protein
MRKKNLFKDLSASTIQTGITQLAGLIIFYLMSRYINKEEFGAYGWATAVGITIISIGSLGLDLVLVKRIAAGQDARLMASIHFFHTLLLTIVLLPILLIVQYNFPSFINYHPIFILVVIQLSLTNIANSFKFSLSGLAAFKQLAIISGGFNFFKLALIIALLFAKLFSIKNIVVGLIVSALIEIILSYAYISLHLKTKLKPIYHHSAYKGFIKEALPQLAIVIFDSALARFDWILLGLLSTTTITAEYSFAFRFFELMKMPLIIIAPILFTRFSKLLQEGAIITEDTKKSIQQFYNLELFISLIIPLMMVCAWSQSIDLITDNKYGAVNELTFSILALCIPLQFVINFYWTQGVVQGQLKSIMVIIIGTSILNIAGNLVLIPYWGSKGAAIAYLMSSLAQAYLYHRLIKQDRMKIHSKQLYFFILNAVLAILTARYFCTNTYIAAAVACLFYIIIAIVSKQINIKMIKQII